jgi:bifunctional isochorismate lyase / aryl carrier protein
VPVQRVRRPSFAERGRDQLVGTGVYAHIGCQATAVEAFMRDVRAFLVADAVAEFSRRHHDQACEYVA